MRQQAAIHGRNWHNRRVCFSLNGLTCAGDDANYSKHH
jgi:hypothetical protein